jgi:hypothetical protein
MVTVHFDGMGPTWTVLVQEGLKRFPNITHGIIADADFRPMVASFDKAELDVNASKVLFTMYSPDHTRTRKLDWIYRNVPGVRILRRTHQSLDVPPGPSGNVVVGEVTTLPVDEAEGGYQDRTGGVLGKSQR